jgi:AmiR/NasT family two-component response regulator
MKLFSRSRAPLSACHMQVGQALADIAALAVVLRGRVEAAALAAQLQSALDTRVVVEQAKGVIAQHAGVDMGAAFTALRSYARDRRTRLSAVAGAVVDREIHPRDVLKGDGRSN